LACLDDYPLKRSLSISDLHKTALFNVVGVGCPNVEGAIPTVVSEATTVAVCSAPTDATVVLYAIVAPLPRSGYVRTEKERPVLFQKNLANLAAR
jgi:hypothetical protein